VLCAETTVLRSRMREPPVSILCHRRVAVERHEPTPNTWTCANRSCRSHSKAHDRASSSTSKPMRLLHSRPATMAYSLAAGCGRNLGAHLGEGRALQRSDRCVVEPHAALGTWACASAQCAWLQTKRRPDPSICHGARGHIRPDLPMCENFAAMGLAVARQAAWPKANAALAR
jgi:hypothetical protein